MDQSFEATLRKAGQSITPARREVFAALRSSGPTTVSAIIAAHAKFDRASIYRTLALFRQLGIVEDLISGGKKMIELTDRFDAHHHHLTCTSCGKSVTITDPPIERRLDAIAGLHGFKPIGHQIEISGLCKSCQAT